MVWPPAAAWQGWLDSNQRVRESKSLALPLGYTPVCGERRGPEQKLRPFRLDVGWVKGLEPSTPGTTIRCSNQLSYTHHIGSSWGPVLLRRGTPGGTRTPGPLLRRQLLYPPELQAHTGAGDGNRTHATSLEGWDSTIELHPHGRRFSHISFRILSYFSRSVNGFPKKIYRDKISTPARISATPISFRRVTRSPRKMADRAMDQT